MDSEIQEQVRFAELAKIRQARAMSPAEKFLSGAELFEEACRWSLAGIASRFPDLSDEERSKKLKNLLNLAGP